MWTILSVRGGDDFYQTGFLWWFSFSKPALNHFHSNLFYFFFLVVLLDLFTPVAYKTSGHDRSFL